MMTIQELEREIERRVSQRAKINQNIDAFCASRFGITNFSETVDEVFAGQTNFGICIGRQIPTVNIEHLAHGLLVKWLTDQGLNCEETPLAFADDCYSGESPLKKSYIAPPFMERRGGIIRCRNKKIVPKWERGCLSGRILSTIPTISDKPLPEYHYALRAEILGQHVPPTDISPFFLSFLKTCLKERPEQMPDFVYVQQGNLAKRMRSDLLGNNDYILLRPPAEWYYLFHLLMYVDGQRALLFTIGDTEDFLVMFEKTINVVESIAGFTPLIVYTPDKVRVNGYESQHLTEFPNWIFDQPNWQAKIAMPNTDSTLFDAYGHFERQLIEFA